MSSEFAKSVLDELNKFRSSPKSIHHQCELVRKGFSRIRAGDPFLKDIDFFLDQLDSMKTLPVLEFNQILSEAAKRELPSFRGKRGYMKYRRSNGVKGIVPEYYLVASPALAADDGADDPINVLTKILLDKQDRLKEGRDILCDPLFTQVGIAHEVYDDENMIIMIFAREFVPDEPKFELPFGNITELKKAFDILDGDEKEVLDMKEIMETLDEMKFYKTDPSREGLRTIFDLFIDDPDKGTITFETFKKICNEVECGLSEEQLNDIFKIATSNGNEITFKEFEQYMSIPPEK